MNMPSFLTALYVLLKFVLCLCDGWCVLLEDESCDFHQSRGNEKGIECCTQSVFISGPSKSGSIQEGQLPFPFSPQLNLGSQCVHVILCNL